MLIKAESRKINKINRSKILIHLEFQEKAVISRNKIKNKTAKLKSLAKHRKEVSGQFKALSKISTNISSSTNSAPKLTKIFVEKIIEAKTRNSKEDFKQRRKVYNQNKISRRQGSNRGRNIEAFNLGHVVTPTYILKLINSKKLLIVN